MKPTSAPLFWKGKPSGVNCSWETWLSRWVSHPSHRPHNMSIPVLRYCTRVVRDLWDSCLLPIPGLSRQVRVLLIELEEARGNHVVPEEEVSSGDVSSTSEVISQHLVTFRSVEELQKQNQRLLVALRELGDAQEKEEFEATGIKYVRIEFLLCILIVKIHVPLR